jgi:hypothetical protein
MAVETEVQKNQPVGIKSDLFKIEHQLAYINYKLLSDIISSIRVPEQKLHVKYIHSFYIISVSVLHLKRRGRTTFNPYCFRGYYR